jgi:hypothetical protein
MPLKKRVGDLPARKLAFAAPEHIHGAIKQIIGWVEMQGIQHNGKSLTERDLLNSLIAGLYMAGQSNWEKRIESDLAAFDKLNKTFGPDKKKD